MSDPNRDLEKKFTNYLQNKQYERLQFEVEMMGDINTQNNPLIIFYYASSIYLQEKSKQKELLYASDLFEKVYRKSNNHLQSLYNMIAISFKTRVFKNVMLLAKKEHEKNQKDIMLIDGLARINLYLANHKEGINYFRSLFEILPEKLNGRLPFISSLNYASDVSQEEYLQECLKYTGVLEKKLKIEKDFFKIEKKNNGKIKLSFLSADFKTHSVTHFLKDLLKKIDRSNFEIILISNLKIEEHDSSTEDLKKLADQWYDIENYTDSNLVSFLRSLNLEILIDLSGFTIGNRFEAIAQRCAKTQILWLGYNNTLGTKNIDYIISDKNLVNPDEFSTYKEKILFMPSIWNALSPPDKLPDIERNSDDSKFTFCSFNNFLKISEKTIEVWSKIITQTNSNILLKDSLNGGDELKLNIINKFLKYGVKSENLIFLKREKEIYDHLKLYNKADVALDTFPYPGVTTSYEAVLMGLPVLSMKGFNMNSRCGESINKNLGMDHLIADDYEDYVNKAIMLKKDESLKKNYGINLRDKALASPLFDTSLFTKNFEKILKETCN